MPKAMARFSAVEIENFAKARTDKTRHHHDGGGLYLCLDKRGSVNWLYRYMIDGKARTMGLGAYPTVGLAKARKAAALAREARADGRDPLEERDAERSSRRRAMVDRKTFREAAEAYISSKRDGWKSAKHAGQWKSTLYAYAYPLIGDVSVAEIDNAAVLRVLQQEVTVTGTKTKERLWTAKPETASRLRGRLESVLGWAAAGGLRSGDNPARWGGMLEHQLPAKSKTARGQVRHHPALPIDDVPAFLERLRDVGGAGARALEFAILTAARSGEVRGAFWSEIDLSAKVWTIPGERMKAGRLHRVPLSDAAAKLLEALPSAEGTGLVFPAAKGGVLSDMTLSAVTKRMKVDAVPHGFRSSFRDWGAERTTYPNEMLEMALAHSVSDKVEASYRRGDLFLKRRKLMTAWANFCSAPAARIAGNVTPIRSVQ